MPVDGIPFGSQTSVDVMKRRVGLVEVFFQGQSDLRVAIRFLARFLDSCLCCGRNLPRSTSGAHRSLPGVLPLF
jgi:hypothetical protein